MCGSDLGEASLKIVGVTTDDDGIYTCIAVNDMGSASCSASLRVLGEPHPWAGGSSPAPRPRHGRKHDNRSKQELRVALGLPGLVDL